MKLVNTDGLLIFGQGSEWFWSMAQFVVVVVTLVGIYRQLSIARGANAFDQLNRIVGEWESERATRHVLAFLLALREGKSLDSVPYGAASFIADFWEDVAALVKAGHVDRRLVYESLGSNVRSWWAALTPFVRRARIEAGDQRVSEHHEWLAAMMANMDRKAGASVRYDETYITRMLDRWIENLQERIRVAEDLRAVIVRPMSPLAPPATLTVDPDPAASAAPTA